MELVSSGFCQQYCLVVLLFLFLVTAHMAYVMHMVVGDALVSFFNLDFLNICLV
jgi:hypothetical protein